MKPTLLASAAALSLLALAAGCGMPGEEEPAAFPSNDQQPIGYDNPSTQPPPPPQRVAQTIPGEEGQMGAEDPANDEYEDNDPSALTDFKGTLDPYGQWVDDSQYGTVWVPSESVVGSDFAPYVSAGHWAYDDDYVWVSDYSWGWAPFHYGRWTYIGGRGWGWVPGRRYAGAWVSWRTGYDGYGYVGWAPMAPTFYWRGGNAYGMGFYPPRAYAFAPTGALFGSGLSGHIVAGPQVGTVAAGTRSYVPAHPGVGGVGGPTPMSLHISPGAVVAPPANHAGLGQARNFAHPSTAVAMGGHAPAGHEGALAHSGTATSRPSAGYSRGGGYYGGTHSYYGGTRSYYGGTHNYYGGSRSLGSGGYYGGGRSYYHGSPSFGGGYSRNPVFRAPGSATPAPSYHPPSSGSIGGSHSSGGFRGGGFRGGGGRGGGGRR